jgi:hypothetical protein
MLQLETNFHAETKKISKHLSKLKQFLTTSDPSWRQTETKGQRESSPLDLPIEQPTVTFKASYKSSYGSRELKSIVEEE